MVHPTSNRNRSFLDQYRNVPSRPPRPHRHRQRTGGRFAGTPIGAVNPILTIIANALRVADRIANRLK